MEGAIELSVPLEVTLKSGRNWYDVETFADAD
jgi:DNA polymerase I-like protein with 3'-5' exonuclease and polymerase domains